MQTWQLYYYTRVRGGKDPHTWGWRKQQGSGPTGGDRVALGGEAPVFVPGNPGKDVELFLFSALVLAGREVGAALISGTLWIADAVSDRGLEEVLGLPCPRES